MPSRFVIGLLAAAFSISPLRAQMRGSTGMVNVPGRGVAGGFRAHVRRPFVPGRAFLAAPYFYSDYFPEPDTIQSPVPQIVMMQAPPVAAEVPEASPRELLIEWQGDHYARITSAESGGIHGQPAPPDYSEQSSSRAAVIHSDPSAKARELPPVVLLFKDGRKEEVKSYTIVSAVMYSSTDYWSSGSWNRKIQLADLDVPGTLKLNQERGVKFVLPSAANEVVTRP
jgi:hypothetical protein